MVSETRSDAIRKVRVWFAAGGAMVQEAANAAMLQALAAAALKSPSTKHCLLYTSPSPRDSTSS
eukprot:2976227-Prorocentrum_lima.AAC.1